MREYDEDEFARAFRHGLNFLNPAIEGEEGQNAVETAAMEGFWSYGDVVDDDLGSGVSKVHEAIEDSILSEEEVVTLIERETKFRKVSGGRPSKVEYWADRVDDADELYGVDLPWPSDDDEMAIRSSATMSKLRSEVGIS